MPKRNTAMVPEYAKKDNFSKTSIMWLNYMSNGVNIKHALNSGEKELTINNKTYKVDGLCEETNTMYDFYDQAIEKRETIKNTGYNHISTYECQLTENKAFQKFTKISTQEVVEPLNPCHVFYGRTTNATKLLYNLKENEHGHYVDFCSRYRTV